MVKRKNGIFKKHCYYIQKFTVRKKKNIRRTNQATGLDWTTTALIFIRPALNHSISTNILNSEVIENINIPAYVDSNLKKV